MTAPSSRLIELHQQQRVRNLTPREIAERCRLQGVRPAFPQYPMSVIREYEGSAK